MQVRLLVAEVRLLHANINLALMIFGKVLPLFFIDIKS